jgi:hypothetical protein
MANEQVFQAALLIDADNLSPAAVEAAFQYLADRGISVTVRRAYGGHEKLAGMKDVLKRHAVRAFVNQGKGTTDVALVVDAMDLLRDAALPAAVAIGSSDADFAPLALRLREAAKHVLCFAQIDKAAGEDLACAYDDVVYVDSAPSEKVSPAGTAIAAPARKTRTRAAPAKSAEPARKTPVRKTAAKKTVAHAKPVAMEPPVLPLEVQHILAAVPALKTGLPQPLGEVVKLLHDEKLLSMRGSSTKLFKKFQDRFELSPDTQPNRVRYLLP